MELPIASDFHVHCRQGRLMELVVPTLVEGGVGTALIMPNLDPPIFNAIQAMDYKKQLELISPNTEFLMTLYLHLGLTREELLKAKSNGIFGVKLYPKSVTTMSDYGVELENISKYYSIFKEMEEIGLVLNLHGESPSNDLKVSQTLKKNISVINAEIHFLSVLEDLANRFPKLRIVFEHVSTSEAVKVIEKLGSNVAATITAHHLKLTIDDWAGKPHNYCKPVAKFASDRNALWNAIKSGTVFLNLKDLPSSFWEATVLLIQNQRKNAIQAAQECSLAPFFYHY